MFKQRTKFRPETRQPWVKHHIKEIPQADPKAFCDAAIAKEIPHDHIFRTHTLCSKPIRWLANLLNFTYELIERYQQSHVFWITPRAIFFISPKHYLVVGLSEAIRVELRSDYSIRIHSEANYIDTPPLPSAAPQPPSISSTACSPDIPLPTTVPTAPTVDTSPP